MVSLLLIGIACTTEEEQPFPYVTQGDHSQQPDDVPDNLGPSSDNAEADTDDSNSDSSRTDACESIGTDVGFCASDFELPDGNLEMISLHQFAGDVIFLDLSSYI